MSDSSDDEGNEEEYVGNIVNNHVGVERSPDVVLAESIMAGKRKLSTRNAYDRKIRNFCDWVRDHHPIHYDAAKDSAKLPLPHDVISEFMAKISQIRDPRTNTTRPATVSLVGSYRSAIVWMYEKDHLRLDDLTTLTFASFSGGYKRLVAEKKLTGEMKLKEGKTPITFAGYSFLADVALKQKRDHNSGSFSHLFLILCWNLMARSVSVGSIMFQHISWEGDSLLITTPKHKGDQEGNNCYPKHVFANPVNPNICPVLSMAILIFSSGWRRDGAKHMLFTGSSTEARFGKWLRGVLVHSANSLQALGNVSFEIGTHSFRKGVATFVAGCPAGPSPINVFLRAGWSLGAVTSRYIFAGQGGDQVWYHQFHYYIRLG